MTEYFLNTKTISCLDTGEKCKGYKEYLKSKHWKLIRNKYITSDTVCSSCGCKENLQIHHLSYKNVGNEKQCDLIVVCSECHKSIHKNNSIVRKELEVERFKSNAKKKKTDKCKRTCETCNKFTRIKVGNKKKPYCRYTGTLNPQKVCDKYKHYIVEHKIYQKKRLD